jgi:hypothetical protein
MNHLFQAILEQHVNPDNSQAVKDMRQALESGVFYADVIANLCGQLNMGASSVVIDGKNVDVPNLYATRKEAEEAIQEEIEECELRDDEEDEYEGQLMMVKWDGGDIISFFTPCGNHEMRKGDWRYHAGVA